MDRQELENRAGQISTLLSQEKLAEVTALLNQPMTRKERTSLAATAEVLNEARRKTDRELPDLQFSIKYLGNDETLESVTMTKNGKKQTLYSDGASVAGSVPVVEIDGGQLHKVTFSAGKGELTLDRDNVGFTRLDINGKTLLKRLGPALQANGLALWKTASGAAVMGSLQVESDNSVTLSVANGESYVIRKSGEIVKTAPGLTAPSTNESSGKPTLAELKVWFQQNLSKLDLDADGKLSSSEIDSARQRRDPSKLDATYIAGLDSKFWTIDLAGETDGHLSLSDIEKLASDSEHVKHYAADVLRQLNYLSDRTSSLDDRLYGGFGKPIDAIVPEAIGQGQVGDCWMLSVLSAMAQSDPQRLVSMITEMPDGTFTVKFPGHSEPVRVERPTPVELAIHARGDQRGIWPAVIEKAFAQVRDTSLDFKSGVNKLDGGWPTESFMMFTGKPGIAHKPDAGDSVESRERAVIELLTIAKQWNLPVVASTKPTLVSTRTEDGLAYSHVYAILDFDPVARTVTVLNPWNQKPGESGTEGRFVWPLDKLLNNIELLWTVTP